MPNKRKSRRMPGPNARVNSALLRMDRAQGLKAGASARLSKKLGSWNFLLNQHQIQQFNANNEALARSRGSK